MKDVLINIIARNAKAIGAYFSVLLLGLLSSILGDAPADVTIAVEAAIVSFIVWLTANRE